MYTWHHLKFWPRVPRGVPQATWQRVMSFLWAFALTTGESSRKEGRQTDKLFSVVSRRPFWGCTTKSGRGSFVRACV